MKRRTFLQIFGSIGAFFVGGTRASAVVSSTGSNALERLVPAGGPFRMNWALRTWVSAGTERIIHHKMNTELVRVIPASTTRPNWLGKRKVITPMVATRLVDKNHIAVRVIWPKVGFWQRAKPPVYSITVASNGEFPRPISKAGLAADTDAFNSLPDETKDGDRTQIYDWEKARNVTLAEVIAQVKDRDEWHRILRTDPDTFSRMTPEEIAADVRKRMAMRSEDIPASNLIAMVKRGRSLTIKPFSRS